MAFNKKEWMRSYMRRYRRRKRWKPRPGYFDKKAWSRPYMREYMRKRRAKEKVERERNEAINAAIARLSSPAPTAGLSVNDRLAKIDARMADMRLLLEEVCEADDCCRLRFIGRRLLWRSQCPVAATVQRCRRVSCESARNFDPTPIKELGSSLIASL